MAKKRIVLALGTRILLTLGCHRDIECPSSNDLRALDLRGRWIVELTLDSATELANDLVGHGWLMGNFELTSRDSSKDGVVYTGIYNFDLPLLRLYFRQTEKVLAYTPPGDTVHIVLNPSVDHGNMELVARCRAGGLEGRWRTNGDPSRALGHFTLHQ
jgi:hypothetical protein